MGLHNLVFLLTVCLYWKSVSSLSATGENVCSTLVSRRETYSISESYSASYSGSTCCGLFCWDRCRRTRYRTNYRTAYDIRTVYQKEYVCCPGWAASPLSDECTEPICAPGCIHGTCEGPNVCDCFTGYYGPTCENVCSTTVPNCETVDCTDSSNSRCTQCLYHISDVIKAYNLINGQCNQLCSWRSDSRTCYPGTCTSGTNCMCDSNFNTDNNCMRIDETPTVSHCSIVVQDDSRGNYINTREIDCQLPNSPPVYVAVEGNGLSVNWQTRYTGPSVAQYPYPYYVNDFKVGIISASVDWAIAGDTLVLGTIDCNLNHNQDDPNVAIHSCVRYSQLSQSLKSGDSLIITAKSKNGGYLRLNNYDFSASSIVSEPVYYTGKTVTRSVTIIVDLESPFHCSVTEPEAALCTGYPLDIGNPYTKKNEIEIKWSTWTDDESGLIINPYVCKVCKMIANNKVFDSQKSCMDLATSQSEDFYKVVFQPTTPGVYCAILGVTDVTGNVRYARRCFIFDDESSVSIVANNPLSLAVEEETLNLLETDAWTTGEKDIQISWHGHFSNQLHIDQNLLLAIEADTDVIHLDYDSEAHPMGRPLTAIENRGGIIMFEVGVHKDTVGGATFPAFEPTWEFLPNNLVIVYKITAFDRESGIMSVYWQLLSTDFKLTLSEGYTLSFKIDGECNPTECYCILANKYCYNLVLDVIPTLDRGIHGSVTSALLRVTIKNNALLETSQEMEVITSNIGQPAKEDKTKSNGLFIGIGVAIGLVLLIVFLVALIMKGRYRTAGDVVDDNVHQNPAFINNPVVNPYSVSRNISPISPSLCGSDVTISLSGEYASPGLLGVTEGYSSNATTNEINPTNIVRKGVIVQGNHSVVYKGNVSSPVLENVAVKSVKAGNTASEKESILHEIKMMRMLPLHDNVVKLFGFTIIRDPVALVMEYAPHGDLTKFLQQAPQNQSLYSNSSETLSTVQLCTYARHVCCGMQHLQNYKIIHRNLGARNILIDDNMVCKITDFGRAVVADVDGTYVETQEIQLPVRWTAVEGLRNKIFSMKSDVWSFGVLMWEIMSLGSKPYGNKPIKRIAEDVVGGLRLTKPQNCPDAVYLIMEMCWHNVPDRRPTFQQLLTDLDKITKRDQQNAFDGEEYIGLDDWQR